MTSLGVKWSPIAADVLDLVDCVEVSGWSKDGVDRSRPVLLHNIDLDFTLARPDAINDIWLKNAREMICETGSPWLSMHIGFSAEKVYCTDHMIPESEVLSREVCRERFLRSLHAAKYGLDVPLLLENLDYCPEGAYEHICEPEFIREIIEELDCGLLLDLAHARVSADWLGYDLEAYLDGLPLERVVQVHLSSPRRVGERLDDGHFELLEDDYRLFEVILEQCEPTNVLLEYTRDPIALRRQLERLRDMIGGGN